MQLTVGSLFSGAGGMDLGFHRAGMQCKWQVEIDQQASSVLAKHWPDVRRFSDIRKVRKKDLEAVDVVIGGFPCQDLSVAGNRKGLKGERSGLFYELLRVVRLCRPRFVVWENVPGLLSSDDGRDFGRVLRGLADIGYFGAWRVLDARFFGVPQRRRRVFGVFAPRRVGALRCGQILALTEGVCRNPKAGGEAGQDVAFTLTSSVGRNSGGTRVGNAWNTTYVAGTLTGGGRTRSGYNARDESGLIADTLVASAGRRNGQPSKGWEEGHLVTGTFTELGEGHSTYHDAEVAGSLRTNTGGGGVKCNLVSLSARCLTSRGQRNDGDSDNLIPVFGFSNRGNATDVAETLRAGCHGALPPLATHHACDVADTLTVGANQTTGFVGDAIGFVPDVAQPVRTNVFNNSDPGMEATMHVAPAGSVRRLTPRECERLMSWPDDFTRWGHDGTEFADGPRYRMIGNGVVANCAEWIANRIVRFNDDD